MVKAEKDCFTVKYQGRKIEIHKVGCLLCSSKKSKVLYSNLIDIEDRVPGKYVISECERCQFKFLSIRPTEETVLYCYPNDYHAHLEGKRSKFSHLFYTLKHRYDYSRLMKVLKTSPKSLIDIGYGSGGLLLELNKNWGKKCRLAGLDFAKPSTRVLGHSGIEIFTGSLEEMKPVEKFDVVTMNEILEHVYDPVKALKAASGWLKQGGRLVGEVPHFNNPWRKIFSSYWQGFQIPRHMTFFDEYSIEKVLIKAGFKSVSTGNRYSPGDIGVSLCNLLTDKFIPAKKPRQIAVFVPLVVLTAPIIFAEYLIFQHPNILEFSAVKK